MRRGLAVSGETEHGGRFIVECFNPRLDQLGCEPAEIDIRFCTWQFIFLVIVHCWELEINPTVIFV